jgi:hypothetical protein
MLQSTLKGLQMESIADSQGFNLKGLETRVAPTITEGKCEALAKRIAAVLNERQRIGEIRRRLKHEHRLRCAERADGRYLRLRGEAKRTNRRANELDAMYKAVLSSNTADEAIQAHRMTEAS